MVFGAPPHAVLLCRNPKLTRQGQPHQPHHRTNPTTRAYASVVSINPPRFYLYSEFTVVVARKLYDPAAPASDVCVHDTHVYLEGAPNCSNPCVVDVEGWPRDGNFNTVAERIGTGLKFWPRLMNMSTYTTLSALPGNTTAVLWRRVHDLLSKVFHHPDTLAGFVGNPITEGIEASGASCFHWYRVDIGVSEALEPVIYEINSNAETSDSSRGKLGPQYLSFRDLSRMLELDKQTRLPRAERGTWELENAGGWQPITPPA